MTVTVIMTVRMIMTVRVIMSVINFQIFEQSLIELTSAIKDGLVKNSFLFWDIGILIVELIVEMLQTCFMRLFKRF